MRSHNLFVSEVPHLRGLSGSMIDTAGGCAVRRGSRGRGVSVDNLEYSSKEIVRPPILKAIAELAMRR
ncbi:hypothetical protein EV291_1404 [Rhizobium sp. BK068]|nr:hypothetical protein [Rhizobium sp. BK060]TCM66504.1 hypothetical protein EV291_1404 [Rhizobium sp. BK068]